MEMRSMSSVSPACWIMTWGSMSVLARRMPLNASCKSAHSGTQERHSSGGRGVWPADQRRHASEILGEASQARHHADPHLDGQGERGAGL